MKIVPSIATLLCACFTGAGGASVDPQLALSTYLGGDGREAARRVAVSAQGGVFILLDSAFGSLSTGNAPVHRHVPTLPNLPPGFVLPTDPDVAVVKYSPDLRTVEYFAIIGGTGKEEAVTLRVDAQGNPVILLRTDSSDFPMKNPLQPGLQGSNDYAITKLTANGSELAFSTYLGIGSDFSGFGLGGSASDFALDAAGQIVIAGATSSANFTVTDGAFQRQPGTGMPNGFAAKLAADGSRFIYSTYLGGSGADYCQSLALDAQGNAFVGGTTTSANFPLMKALNTERGPMISGRDPEQLFLAKLNASGSALEFSTFLIGEGEVNAITITPQGSVVIAGQSSGGLTVTPNAFHRSISGGFILELNPELTAVAYSTHLGGTTLPLDIALDANGNLAVTGVTTPGSLVTTHAGFVSDNSLNSSGEAFAVKLDPARNVIYSFRFGGLDIDEGHGVAFLPGGDLLVAGLTKSFDFPTTNAAREFPVSDDAFVMRITEVPSNGNGNNPGGEPGTIQTYTDRNSANLPARFYRVRELRP